MTAASAPRGSGAEGIFGKVEATTARSAWIEADGDVDLNFECKTLAKGPEAIESREG